jgi:hypothetical protein
MSPLSHLCAVALVCCSASHATAQGTDSLDGKWKATFVVGVGPAAGKLANANVVFRGTEGTWRTYTAARENPCLGKDTPLSIERKSPDTVEIRLLYSRVQTFCHDETISAKIENGSVIKGHFSGGKPIELSRD